jgi:tight adherence protein C
MSALLPAVPALAVVGCVVLFVAGMRLLRTDAVEGLDVGDLTLLRDRERSRIAGQGPLQRLARPLVPLLRRLIGPAAEARLKRMIELAGRPEGVSVDSVLQRAAVFLVLGLPGGVLLALQGRAWGLVAILAAAVVLRWRASPGCGACARRRSARPCPTSSTCWP